MKKLANLPDGFKGWYIPPFVVVETSFENTPHQFIVEVLSSRTTNSTENDFEKELGLPDGRPLLQLSTTLFPELCPIVQVGQSVDFWEKVVLKLGEIWDSPQSEKMTKIAELEELISLQGQVEGAVSLALEKKLREAFGALNIATVEED